MKRPDKADPALKNRHGETKKPIYKTPKLVVHSGSEFVRKLGPAQACSPSPSFY